MAFDYDSADVNSYANVQSITQMDGFVSSSCMNNLTLKVDIGKLKKSKYFSLTGG